MSDEKKISLDFLGEQMLRMQSDLREVRAGYAAIGSEQAGMRADFKRLEAKLDAHNARFGTLEAKVDAHEARFDTLEAKIDRIDAKVDRHDASNQARYEQTQQTAATNLEIMLKAWKSSQR